MGLKFKIAKLEEVPEAVRSLYVQQGDQFVLEVDGVVPKEKLDEFRNNNIALQQQIDKFKGIDPGKHAELLEIQRQLNEGELLKAGRIDEVVASRVTTLREDLEGKLSTANTALSTANAQLQMLLIDNVVKSAAIRSGVEPDAVEDVVLRAKTLFSIEAGKPVPKADGKVIYGKDGVSPMSVDEWMTSLKTSAKHLFMGSRGSGAGGGSGSSGKPDFKSMTPAQKIAFGLTNSSAQPPA